MKTFGLIVLAFVAMVAAVLTWPGRRARVLADAIRAAGPFPFGCRSLSKAAPTTPQVQDRRVGVHITLQNGRTYGIAR